MCVHAYACVCARICVCVICNLHIQDSESEPDGMYTTDVGAYQQACKTNTKGIQRSASCCTCSPTSVSHSPPGHMTVPRPPPSQPPFPPGPRQGPRMSTLYHRTLSSITWRGGPSRWTHIAQDSHPLHRAMSYHQVLSATSVWKPKRLSTKTHRYRSPCTTFHHPPRADTGPASIRSGGTSVSTRLTGYPGFPRCRLAGPSF